MNQLIAQADELQRVVDARGWRSCIIGARQIGHSHRHCAGGIPFEEEIIDRASEYEYVPGIRLRTVSAEDLIVLKAFANRRHDWSDIAGIVARQLVLDWAEIVARLSPLAELKGEPAILVELERVRLEVTREW